MSGTDLRTQAFLQDISLYCHANSYDLDALKRILVKPSEWSERLRRNFDHVLEKRSLTANDYARRTDIDFEDDEALFYYLKALYDFLFSGGPYPEIQS